MPYHDDVGVAAVFTNTDVRLPADVADGVGGGGGTLVGDLDADNVDVEIMVGKDHAAVGGAAIWPVDVTVEEVVLGRAERGLEVMVELGDDVGDLAQVGVVVCMATKCQFLLLAAFTLL